LNSRHVQHGCHRIRDVTRRQRVWRCIYTCASALPCRILEVSLRSALRLIPFTVDAMLKPIAQLIGAYLNGSHGPMGRIQGAVAAISLTFGFFKLCHMGFAVDLFFWRQFIRRGKSLKKYGSWAAVTGATNGIGRAYCDELAKQGTSLGRPLCRAISRLQVPAAGRICFRFVACTSQELAFRDI
jgi:hypothetical protein